MDALETAYVQGRLQDDIVAYIHSLLMTSRAKKKSLVDQFKSCIKISSSTVSEDQFFRECVLFVLLMSSYFPNGEHSLGVNILQDVEGKIQTLRDETVFFVSSFFIFRSKLLTILIIVFKESEPRRLSLMPFKFLTRSPKCLMEFICRIKKCIEYAHKSFDYHDSIEEMIDKLNEDDCDDDSNIQDSSILAMITNIKDELQQNFQQIKFLSVCCC